ncbi:MAG: LOG family protein [Rhodospirillales bacterium]
MSFHVCVYCGSRNGDDPAFAEAAAAFGRGLAERGMTLVYGAGGVGLMGALSNAALDAGARTIGVIPTFLKEWEVENIRCSELIETADMHERKKSMFDLSDIFVTLPGGLGTLDETFEIITWRQLDRHDKPVLIFNQNGYWRPFLDLTRAAVEKGFAPRRSLDLFESFDQLEPLWRRIDELALAKNAAGRA